LLREAGKHAKPKSDKIQKIMVKAEELFLKHGYSGVSIDRIAHESEISKMTIYKHFASKEELFIEVLKNYTDYHMAHIMGVINEKYHTMDKIESLFIYTLQLSNSFPPKLIKDIMEREDIMVRLSAYKQEKSLALWINILE
jgi:AcrR family transcriptional regulator